MSGDAKVSIDQLSEQQLAVLAIRKAQAKLADAEARRHEPIAIISMACRFPGGCDTPEKLWELLAAGRHAITEVPKDRWNIEDYYDPDPDKPAKMYTRWGGFLDNIADFDAKFFDITPKEAASIDPQQRLLLEVGWECIERAGIDATTLAGTSTGVFVGISTNDYAIRAFGGADASLITPFSGSGNAASVAAGRLAYTLGLHGPAIAIDTACSSSLVALHLAVRSLRADEVKAALVGGANLMLRPEPTIYFCRTRMMAPDGLCKTFDAGADGYVRGEGCAVLLLKKLSDAVAAGDPIVAVIRGSAVNQDGRSNGLTAPNRQAQQAVIRAALADAQLPPHAVDYVEAHGTGTPLGDPIEIEALGAEYGRARNGRPLQVGSIKTNFGHTEAVAGLAGVIKSALALSHRQIPAHLHLKRLNPYVDWTEAGIAVPTETTDWSATAAAVSSFGFSGTNAHVILEAAPRRQSEAHDRRSSHLIALSAKSEAALRDLRLQVASALESGRFDLPGCAAIASRGRATFEHRVGIVAGSAAEAVSALRSTPDDKNPALSAGAVAQPVKRPLVAFLFTGQGSQYVGMGRKLYDSEPVFRDCLDACDEKLRPYLKQPLLSVLYPTADSRNSEETLRQTAFTQPALFAFEIALARLWESWGVVPDWVMGHSVGEIAAACFADVLSLDDGLRLIAERARLMQQLPAGGAMLAVLAGEALVRDMMRGELAELSIAAVNGANNTVVSGNGRLIDAFADRLDQKGIRAVPLHVSHAFHSTLMEPMLADFEEVAASITYKPARFGIVSNCTGRPYEPGMPDARYWVRHVREAVRFADGTRALGDLGCTTFIEIGPGTTLLSMARPCLPAGSVLLPSLRREGPEHQHIESLAKLFIAGVNVRWPAGKAVRPDGVGRYPTYPFQRERYWAEAVPFGTGDMLVSAARPSSDGRTELANGTICFDRRIDIGSTSYLKAHAIVGEVIVPAATFLDMMTSDAATVSGDGEHALRDVAFVEPLRLSDASQRNLQILFDRNDAGGFDISVFSRDSTDGTGWTCHARAVLSVESPTESSEARQWPQPTTQIAGSEFYRAIRERGYHYGQELQCIRALRCDHGVVRAELALPDSERKNAEAYCVHPALIDAAFQTIGALPEIAETKGLLVPVGISEATIRKRPVTTCVSLVRSEASSDPDGFQFSVELRTEDGVELARLSGLRVRELLTAAEMACVTTTGSVEESIFEIHWTPIPYAPRPGTAANLIVPSELARHIANRAELRRSGMLDQYERLEPRLERIASAYAKHALGRLGWRSGLKARDVGIDASRQRLFDRIVEIAGEAGSVDPAREMIELGQQFPAFGLELSLLERCGSALADVLQNTVDPLTLVMPDGDTSALENVYRSAPAARVLNQSAAWAVSEAASALPAGRTIRILEIGAGTGGTTAGVLEALHGRPLEYVFTDVSANFVAVAQRRFAHDRRVRCQSFDVQKDPTAQELAAASFDIVLAANVLHATADIRSGLQQARRLLAPGGLLILVETTRKQAWADITFGLLPGWWNFADPDLRQDHPLLDEARWCDVLSEAGFEDVVVAQGGKAARPGLASQVLLIARQPASHVSTTVPGRYLVLDDGAEFACELIAVLEQSDGVTVDRAHPDDLGRMIAALPAGEGYSAIFQLCTAAAESCDHLQTFAREQSKSSGSLLSTVQTLASARVRTLPRLLMVTRGAQTIADEVNANALAHAALSGLARVVTAEYPELRFKRIDLDPQSKSVARDVGAFVSELASEDCEDQIAFRGSARLCPRLVPINSGEALPIENGPCRLESAERGSLDQLRLVAFALSPPKPGEVQVRIQAAGLNFRDVLSALGTYPGEALPYGNEACGQVTAIGPGVARFAVGDEVVVVGPGVFATHLCVAERMVAHRPRCLSVHDAACAPIAFLSALYGLHELGRIQHGERVLIHSASGGVGLAAIQVAQQAGASIIASAGSAKKRAFLRKLGVEHVIDSRAPFASEIFALTHGEGVDVVLNSLAGDAIPAGLRVLRKGGRFIELGKADLWSTERARALDGVQSDITYAAFDLGNVLRNDATLLPHALERVLSDLAAGTWKPLPSRAFSLRAAPAAFRHMAQARHIGKIVLSIDDGSTAASNIRADATYLITGGLGGLGLLFAQWLCRQGARHIVLTSRRVTGEDASEILERMRADGANIEVAQVDVGNPEQLTSLLERVRGGPPLRGIIHAAGTLDDGVLLNQSWERFEKVLAPKAYAAWLLDRLTDDCDLDFFVLFSSTASLLGPAGQGNHAAANAVLDALALQRRARGKAALGINWGAWGEIGAVANHPLSPQMTKWGMRRLLPSEGVAAFEWMLARSPGQAAVVPVRRDQLRKAAQAGGLPPFFMELTDQDRADRESTTPAASGTLVSQLRSAPLSSRRSLLVSELQSMVATAIGLREKVASDRPLGEYGLDSLIAVELGNRLKKAFGYNFAATVLFDYPTIDALADFLTREIPDLFESRHAQPEAAAPSVSQVDNDSAIAVIGIGCRLPGGVDDPDSFWHLLKDGQDGIGDVPAERWKLDEWFDPVAGTPGKMSSRFGGFIAGVDLFDPQFFGISPREADSMDPQQRLLLEVSWEALERAGIAPGQLNGSETGVFVGVCSSDYGQLLLADPSQLDLYMPTGNAASVVSGRLSYALGLQGPSISVDTACSSSLVAIHLARQSILSGECDLAIAGGVNLTLAPRTTAALSQLRMLASDGHCKTFDARADGFVRGEGCAVVVLKRLSAALSDRDRILAVLRGTAVNQDGRSSGLTAPNGPAQEKVIRRALSAAGVEAAQIDFIETHGTGTALGDPIEVGALSAVFGTQRETPLYLGAVKTNLGHLEAAAGVAGFVKAVLSLDRGEIPPNLHFQSPNPHIAWNDYLRVPMRSVDWKARSSPRLAGVSSFGFSGTNAHAVLEGADHYVCPPTPLAGPGLLVLSAKSAESLKRLAERYIAAFEREPGLAFGSDCFTAATGRDHWRYRLAVLAEDRLDAAAKLKAFVAGEPHHSVWAGHSEDIPVAVVRGADAAADDQIRLLENWGIQPERHDVRSDATRQSGAVVFDGSLGRSKEELAGFAYAAGLSIDWIRFYGGQAHTKTVLPTYPFERSRHWVAERTASATSSRPQDDIVYEIAWQPADGVEVSTRDLCKSFNPVLSDAAVRTYLDHLPALNALAAAYVLQAFRDLGADIGPGAPISEAKLVERGNIPHRYRRLLRRLMGIATEAGLLTANGQGHYLSKTVGTDPAILAARLEHDAPEVATELRLLKRCGLGTAQVLRGKEDPLALIFPAGSFEDAEAIYGRSAGARAINNVAADALDTWIKSRPPSRKLRILEIGAGTGATAAALLSRLPAERVEYVFTDRGASFIAAARKKFSNVRNVSFGVLDITAPSSHAFEEESFDAVIAANVLHATPDLRQALSNAQRLLSPGGLLVVAEVTQQQAWLDLVFGLTDEWWSFEDTDLRPSHPLVGRDSWVALLADLGFRDVSAFSGVEESPQTLLLATKSERSRRDLSRCLIVSQRNELAGAFIKALEPRGRCRIVDPEQEDIVEVVRSQEWTDVIYLGAFDARESPDSVLGYFDLIKIARTIGRSDGAQTQLWVVTSGAQPVEPYREAVNVFHAPLWGIGRVLSLECPSCWGGLVDLDPAVSAAAQADLLIAHLERPEREAEIAFRGVGQRFVPRLVRREVRAPAPKPKPQGSYMIVGGLGALGLHYARWLAGKGASHIVLTSRNGLPDRSSWNDTGLDANLRSRIDGIRAVEKCGASVEVARVDAGDRASMQALVDSLPNLRGVAFLAGLSIGRDIQEFSADDFKSVLWPKLYGGYVIDQVTRNRDLDFLVFFSSAASVWGSRGAAGYAGANQFLDALAHARRARGLPGTVANWGRLSVRGMLGEEEERLLAGIGIRPVDIDAGYETLDALVQEGATQAIIAEIEWSRFLSHYRVRNRGRRFEWIEAERNAVHQTAIEPTTSPRIVLDQGAPYSHRYEMSLAELCRLAAGLLGFQSPLDVNCKIGFFQLGMDSLTAVEFKDQIERTFGISVPTTALFKYANLEELAVHLAGGEQDKGEGATAEAQNAGPVADDGLLGRIQGMNDDEVDRLLLAWEQRSDTDGVAP